MSDYLARILRCDDCLNDKCHIVPDCIPAPFFGRPESSEVVSVGINPSAGEYFDDQVLGQMRLKFPMLLDSWNCSDWAAKPPGQRLALLRDFGRNSRKSLSEDDLDQVSRALVTYFTDSERKTHPFFTRLQKLLSQVDERWSYTKGTAAHIDIAACTTAKDWAAVSVGARSQIAANCKKHFSAVLRMLGQASWLMVDGARAWNTLGDVYTLTRCCGGAAVSHETENRRLQWISGRVDPADLNLRFIAWNYPWQQIRAKDLSAYLVQIVTAIVHFDGVDEELREEIERLENSLGMADSMGLDGEREQNL